MVIPSVTPGKEFSVLWAFVLILAYRRLSRSPTKVVGNLVF
jgi:hypothetical protein